MWGWAVSASVWKFPMAFPTLDREGITMPGGSKVLHVAFQHRVLTLWALVEESAPTVIRRFAVVGTGHTALSPQQGSYVGTVLDDPFVWHVFEEL